MSQYYGRILADSDRIHAFDLAICKAVTPDDVVVDLGCGLGTYAMFAARAGARRVFAVDFDPVIELAKQISERNRSGVEFITGNARDVDLPEAATVLVFEDFSTGLLDGPVPETLEIVQNRWMAENYRVVPERVNLNLAPVQCASAWHEALPAESLGDRPFGLDFQPLVETSRNCISYIRSPGDLSLLAPSRTVLDHPMLESLPSRWSTKGEFELSGGESFDGLCLWFDLLLNDTESYSNKPSSKGVWGQMYFPAPERWTVRPGDKLQFGLRFESTAFDGAWKWSFKLLGADGETRFRWAANTFAATALTSHSLQQYREDKIVKLSPRGQQEAIVLSLVNGQRTLQEICTMTQEQCHFPDRKTALALVLQTLQKRRVF
ncbi:MAG: methyltransferase domain-containing protein [Gammaproteobacteria bacterium]|nr:methyltransferase domain-containing protein [Gammaproteobacteria bacterium]